MHIEDLVRKEVKLLEPYLPGQSIEEVTEKLGLAEVINLSTNESVLGPSAVVKKALKSELNHMHRYPDSSSRLLREKLAVKYGIDPDMVIVTNGGDELLYLLGSCFISPDDEVVIGEYGFKTYESVSALFGGKIIAVPLKDQHLNLVEIAGEVNEKTKVIFLCNPHNPNGTVFTHHDLVEFLSNIPTHPIVVLDEAYSDFVESNHFPDSVKLIKEDSHHMIALRTFSKIGGMAGLRVGFGIAQKELINYLKKVQPPYSVNSMAQVAAGSFLLDSEYRERLLQNNQQGKRYLYRELKKLDLSYIPTQANFIFIDLKQDAGLVCEKLMAEGVIVRSGKIWGRDTCIRVTIGTEKQNQQLINSLEKIL
jgi:histidinol-phosphate aminotransferase